MISETWLSVVGYEGLYEVSDQGRIRSLFYQGHVRKAPKVLVVRRNKKTGRPVIGIFKDGAKVYRNVYRLVLEAFVGPCPEGMEACHWDGDSMNSRLENLRWDTRAGNIADKRRHGIRMGQPAGEGHALARITWNDVRAIRAEPRSARVNQMLADAFGLSVNYISQIRSRKFWKGDGPMGASPATGT